MNGNRKSRLYLVAALVNALAAGCDQQAGDVAATPAAVRSAFSSRSACSAQSTQGGVFRRATRAHRLLSGCLYRRRQIDPRGRLSICAWQGGRGGRDQGTPARTTRLGGCDRSRRVPGRDVLNHERGCAGARPGSTPSSCRSLTTIEEREQWFTQYVVKSNRGSTPQHPRFMQDVTQRSVPGRLNWQPRKGTTNPASSRPLRPSSGARLQGGCIAMSSSATCTCRTR